MSNEESDDILKNIAESLPPHCGIKQKLTLKDRIINKIKSSSPRRWIGRKILGYPIPGSGILVQVDLGRKSKEEVENFHQAIKYLRRAGIGFDTGYGCYYDMEFDWSLKGAIATCKRCGYSSEINRIQLDNKKAKEYFEVPCEKCGKIVTSSFDFLPRSTWTSIPDPGIG